jgi:hypothetical protein
MSKSHLQIYKRLTEDYKSTVAIWNQINQIPKDIEKIKQEMCSSQILRGYAKDEIVSDTTIRDSLYVGLSSIKKWNTNLAKYIKENDHSLEQLSQDLANVKMIYTALMRCRQDAKLFIDSLALELFKKNIEKDNKNYLEEITKKNPDLEKYVSFKKIEDYEEGVSDPSTQDSEHLSLRKSSLSSSEEVNKNIDYKLDSELPQKMTTDRSKLTQESILTNTQKQSSHINLDMFKAVEEGDIELVEQLIKSGVSVNIQDEYNSTPLYKAVLYNHIELAKVLLDHYANPNMPCRAGLTALHIAAENGNKEILELLVQKNGNIDSVNVDGSSIMHSAAIGIKDGKDNWGIIEWLVNQGANPFIENDRHQNPRDILNKHDWSYAEKYDDLLEMLGCYTETSNNTN